MARGRWNGGIIGPNLKVSTSSASGIFSLSEAQVDVSAGLLPQQPTPPPPPTDPQFNSTTLLLHGDGSTTNNNTFLDESTNALSITRNGTPTQGTFSPFSQTGWNYYCNYATPDYFTVATSGSPVAALGLGTGAFTIEFWVFPIVGINTWNALFDINQYTGGILMRYQGGSDSLYILGSAYDWLPVTNLKLGQWSHIALSRNASGVFRMYVNGTSVVTGTNAGNIGSTGYMAINAAQHAGGQNLTAHYSNFRIVKGSAVYDPTVTTLTVPTAPLTAIANTVFLSFQNKNFADNSTSALTVNTSGSPAAQPFSPFAPGGAYGVSSVGGSIYLGSSNYLSASSNSGLSFGTGDFTIEFWMYPTAAFSTTRIFSTYTNGIAIYPNNSGNILVDAYGVATRVTTSSTVSINNWTHIAVARSSGTTTVYINGVSGGSGADSTNYSNSGLYVGTDNGTNFYTGYISNLRVVKGTAVYTSNFTPPTSPVTAISGTQLLLNGTNSGVYDSTAKNDVLTTGSAQISTSQSKYGGSSMYFVKANGTDALTLPASPNWSFSTGDFTVEFWLKTSTTASNIIWVTGGWAIVIVSGNTYWQTTQGVSSLFYTATGSINDNSWHHFAVSRASGTIRMYLDGVLYATYGSTDSTNYNTVGQLNIGYNGAYGWYDGYLDDIRITKGYARYSGTSSFTPPTASFANQ
jgi:hypothetical protein